MSPTKNTEETAIANINARAVNWFMGLASTVLIACFALLWNINAKQVEYWKHVAANSPVVLNAAIQSNIIANFL